MSYAYIHAHVTHKTHACGQQTHVHNLTPVLSPKWHSPPVACSPLHAKWLHTHAAPERSWGRGEGEGEGREGREEATKGEEGGGRERKEGEREGGEKRGEGREQKKEAMQVSHTPSFTW